MARRKGSGRGKSTVNSRSKSTLENAREKLRDDPGGTKKDQTETVTNLSNMEATTATTPAATTTTKYYNKTKLQQQNNNNQQLPQNKSTTATTNSSKKAQQQQQQQQTYRDLEDRQEPQKKLTAKQAKQAAKLEAQQKQQQQNVKNADSQQQQQRQQQQQHNKNVSKTITSSVLEKEKSITNSNLPATTTNIAPQQHQPTTATTTTANNANKNINNNLNVAKSSTSASVTTTNNSGSNMDYVNSISNSSNFNKSDTTTSSNSNNKEQLSNPTPNSTSDNFNSAGPGTGTGATGSDNNWSNSKYLHKKFKRLASTTETDGGVGQDAEKLRTTSISSASSSVSSPPPPSTPASAIVQPQNETTKPAHETNEQQQHHNLQNGYLSQQEVVDNAVLQNKILLQMAQQQQMVANNTSTSNNPAELSNGSNSSASSATATNASGGSGRYICPYCNLSCTKPSVLQKHIRAHTNERPYPCDICGIAFKTKSNLYKHCRSRSHAARQKGIEVPPDADDGLSDQDVDPELSNSSSEMLSRTDSPMEDVAIVSQIQQQQQQMNEPHTLIPTPMNSNSSIGASPLPASPASRGSAHQAGTQPQPSPIAHQHQQQQHQSQLPLGSPAAGTLAPTSATINQNNVGGSNSSAAKQAIDYKPYKPKFHNAALYNSPKEAAAAAAAAATTNIVSAETNPTPAANNTRGEIVATSQPPPQTKQPEMGIVAGSTGVCLPQALNHQQYQQLLIEAQKYASSQVGHSPAAPIGGGSAAGGGGQPPSSVPHQLHHHPTLSPSTQIKLNNHISSHQLQQQLQQQQQQLHQLAQAQAAQHPHHLLAPPSANALSLPMAAAAYYLGPPPGAFYNPMTVAHQQAFASLHLMTQQEQQQFRHQLQLQQHLQQLQHSGVLTPATVVAAPQPPPPPSQPTPLIAVAQSGPQTASSPSPGQNHIKTHTPVMGNTGVVRPTPTSVNNTALHLSKPSPAAIPVTNVPQQSPLHYLASAALNSQSVANNKLAGEIVSSEPLQQQHQMSNSGGHQRPNANHNSQNSNNAGEVPLNKENLHERINKIISQNEAIVENKELLLQKKYPKTLNRSRSFTNANNSASSGSSAGSTQTLQSTTGGPPSESPTNAKLAQVIVQKQQLQQQQQQQQQLQQQQQQYLYQQQLQQQQQQMQKQRHMYSEKVNMEDVVLPLNGTSKNVMSKHLPNQTQTQALPPQSNQPLANQGLHPTQMHPYRGPNSTTNTQANSQNQTPAPTNSPAMANVPLNLSAKSKAPIVVEERIDLSISKQPQGPLPQQPPPATPRKRHSIEQASQPTAIVNPAALNEASNSSNSNSQAAHQATAVASSSSSAPAAGKYAPNHSIIKNLLLNARGLAVPMGEGEDAVYICPLCSTEFRTAEDLQLHNSAYCQGNNSSANSPASSPSHKYFRSSSIHSLNMSDLKILSKNPLSLAKLAWSQLKIKPSNLVLDRLSASQANTSKSNSSTTTSETSTQPSCSTTTQLAAGTSNSTLANQSTSTSSSNNSGATAAKSHLALNDIPIRFVDAPLPSPGPLLGKTPLVDYTPNDTKHKSEEVIITKMHDDRMYTNMNFNEHHHHATVVASSASSLAINNKRLKFETSANNKRLTNITSGGEMQPLNPLEISKKEERLKRFTSSGGCMIPLSECDDVDKSPKMIRTPLLSGGSFQEVSPKKETKLPVPLIQGAQLTPKLALGLSTSSSGPQHFQFPPINQITAFNPLTLPLTEKVIPYVPGIPGPNSLTPQMHLPQQPQPQQQQQLHLQVPPQQKPRTVSPNRKLALSPNEPGTSSNKSVTTFGGVQNVPSEFSKAPPTANMRNIKNWNSTSGSSSNKLNLPVAAAGGEVKQSSKSFNFLRMADNLSPRKLMAETETRHFNLERVAKDQLNIQQPTSVSNIGGAQALSPTAATSSSTLTPLHVDTSPGQVGPNESAIVMESKPKSKFLRPTSLPLRPGTFTPKRHHGITPTANTLPLISPETPRPSKECVQLYLNGNSYTYLGLKSSTKTFYCTLNCPQPSYVQDMHKLSMYSMWQQCAENNPHPLGLKPKEVMSLYDSRQKVQIYNMAESKKLAYTVVDAQQMVMTPFLSSQDKFYHHQLKRVAVSEEESAANKEDNKSTGVEHRDSSQMSNNSASTSSSSSQTLVGGYESNENYTYIRGRGRGKYVCSECGIRCKKPSMLKKHIRTHTDVRPYTCKHCNFSFKTKGNLTKHMQSKTHYKKCIELGLNPGPMPADGEFLEPDMEFDQQSSTSAGGRTSSMGNAESDTDGDSSDNETESSNESDSAAVTRSSVPSSVAPPSITVNAASEDNKSHLEHEAARCLLSLSMTPPIHSQSTETSAQMVVTTVMATSATATTTTPSAIRRVISYTSPKPPFDYQKQEQYYSNPEEAMPKNKAINNFEAAPMDLTKPRSSDVSVTTVNSLPATVLVHASLQNSSSNNKQPSLSSLPGPVQTQAQIDDVIFGGNRDESGLLKTMISVSSKVARSQPGISEEVRNLNEDMMLYDYRREQTLQYNKIKQTQLSRSLASTANEVATTTTMASSNAYVNAMSSSTATTVTQVCSSISSVTATVISSRDSAIVSSGVTTTPAVTTAAIMGEKSKTEIPVQVPKIEVVEPVEQSPRTKSNEVSSSAFHPASVTNVEIRKPPPANQTKTSSDESEETDDEPPAKKHLTMGSEEKISGHNSNLPAAVLQPGTTDFSGVLSGGSNSSSSAGGASSQLPTRTVIVGEDGFTTTNNEILPVHPKVPPLTNADGRPVCSICSKTFQKQPQLILHMNIHYMERKYKCDPCGVSFRTQGHLQKHERSEAHKNKVIMTSTFGVPTTSNPRPFECTDCKIAFRIHGHLAKHLRSKTHVQKLECLQKLPFGTYAEIERAGISLTEIDTSDCENSLISLRLLAQKLIEKDPSSKLGSYTTPSGVQDNNSNTGLVSQDSASEDGFQAAASAAASAIASLDNDSAANTPRRANSTSEDESIAMALNSNLKRRLPGAFSNGDDSDKDIQDDKRLRQDLGGNHQMQSAASPPAN